MTPIVTELDEETGEWEISDKQSLDQLIDAINDKGNDDAD